MSNIDLSKYPLQIQLTYKFFRVYPFRNDSIKNDLHVQSINQLPIELQEDLISHKHGSVRIHLINHHTLTMWQTLLSKDLKLIKYLNRDNCFKYNCYDEVIELYKFLKV